MTWVEFHRDNPETWPPVQKYVLVRTIEQPEQDVVGFLRADGSWDVGEVTHWNDCLVAVVPAGQGSK